MFGIRNPQALLQPWRSLTQFTEELFAMLEGTTPAEQQGAEAIRAPEVQAAPRIDRGGPTLPAGQTVLRPRPAPPTSPPAPREPVVRERASAARVQPVAQEASARVQPLPAPAPPIQSEPPPRVQPLPAQPPPIAQPPIAQPGPVVVPPFPVAPAPSGPLPPPIAQPQTVAPFAAAPAPPLAHDPVKFQAPPEVFDQAQGKYRKLEFNLPELPIASTPGGGGTTVFIGKVVSGSGDEYSVALYPDGPDGDAGDTVTVKIPTIADDETIDPNTWLFGIFQFTDDDGNETYSCQPPIWTA